MSRKNTLSRPLKVNLDASRLIDMNLLIKKPAYRSTSFAEFISSASSGEKKRVYADVLKKTSESQRGVVAAAAKSNTPA